LPNRPSRLRSSRSRHRTRAPLPRLSPSTFSRRLLRKRVRVSLSCRLRVWNFLLPPLSLPSSPRRLHRGHLDSICPKRRQSDLPSPPRHLGRRQRTENQRGKTKYVNQGRRIHLRLSTGRSLSLKETESLPPPRGGPIFNLKKKRKRM